MGIRTWTALGWLPLEAALPGATLLLILVWLSQLFLRDRFADLRQHAFAPAGGNAGLAVLRPRNWWSCACRDCTCLMTLAGALRRCCDKLVRPAAALSLAR